jgi:hypothetical protein
MENASSAFTNLTSQFQHELASQLGLIDIQVQIQAFQFGNNFSLNMVVNLGPLVGLAFPLPKIESINKTLTAHSVKFSSVLFSNYTVVSVMAFLPPPPPIGELRLMCIPKLVLRVMIWRLSSILFRRHCFLVHSRMEVNSLYRWIFLFILFEIGLYLHFLLQLGSSLANTNAKVLRQVAQVPVLRQHHRLLKMGLQ